MMTPEELRSIRLKLKLTQKELGDMTGYSEHSIRHFEAGRREIKDRLVKALYRMEKDHIYSSPKEIIIIEDSQDDYEITKKALVKANINNPVVHFKNGIEALRYLRDNDKETYNPLVLLVDYYLPDLNGSEILKALTEYHFSGKSPVVVFSNHHTSELEKECVEQGASCFIQKPQDFIGFIQVIQQLSSSWLVN